MLIRALTLLDVACIAGGIVFIAIGAAFPAVIALLLAMLISVVLALRAAALRIRGAISDARAFITGGVQRARLVEVTEPRGWIWPKSNVVLELEGADGKVHRIEREVPIASPYAWGYRLGKRFNLPLLSKVDLAKTLAFELSREGTNVEVGRPRAGAAA